MKPDINQVLKVYLGSDENGGYQPLYQEERMERAFHDNRLEMLKLITPYLEEDHKPENWSERDLIQEASRFAEKLRQKFPELDEVAIKALANRWSFGWR